MASSRPSSASYTQQLRDFCTENSIEQPQWQDFSDPRVPLIFGPGKRTAWSSSVWVQGREYRAVLWRDVRYIEHCREEAAKLALDALSASATTYYAYGRAYSGA
ncbi:uncharacterized protein BDR25DRAFT_311315 [Lindgomyces ingoldianus]|uniref:Uncharacterized protein n=1 Tax=Lindgomyces ingoldianus TaxID=673940 RepID=A0ACB6R754_9PLEO|nr:uncharacterized protein BDR25DRAFT_311315 [Lindgomyces ingoldianus]KAF2474917.1 hypothetical protein BDR25DRAFT_311315 [Lindgomyces ingoldianus]